MKKRMILVLVAIVVFVFTIGMVKYGQIKKGMAQHASFQMPPEAVTTVVAKPRSGRRCVGDRNGRGRARRDRQRGPARGRRADRRSSPARRVRAGDVLVQLDTRQEQAQLAAAEAQRELAKREPRPPARPARQKGIARPGRLRQRRRGAARRRRRGSARSGRRSRARRSARRSPASSASARSTSASTSQSGSPIVPLQSLDPIYVNFSVPQQDVGRAEGRRRRARHGRGRSDGRAATGQDHGDQLGRRRGDAQRPGPGDARQPGRQAPARDVRRDERRASARRRAVIALPASAINYAPYGDSVFVVDGDEGPGRQGLQAACASSS